MTGNGSAALPGLDGHPENRGHLNPRQLRRARFRQAVHVLRGLLDGTRMTQFCPGQPSLQNPGRPAWHTLTTRIDNRLTNHLRTVAPHTLGRALLIYYL